MAKIKLTKGELKRQRDALRQYERYLPTLQLKKQQLQMEIIKQSMQLEETEYKEDTKRKEIDSWLGLLSDREINIHSWVVAQKVVTSARNIAGVDVPVFSHTEFVPTEYDLFLAPLWVDAAIEAIRTLVSLRQQVKVIRGGLAILKQELRTTTQRVNLFEKVKIPESTEAIRRIKIYLGDQMTNAVGRSKIAKKKIEQAFAEGVAVA